MSEEYKPYRSMIDGRRLSNKEKYELKSEAQTVMQNQALIGKTILKIERNNNSDEGFIFHFSDGSKFAFGYSSFAGEIEFKNE